MGPAETREGNGRARRKAGRNVPNGHLEGVSVVWRGGVCRQHQGPDMGER